MNDRPIRNYHTHTWRCQHALGDAIDYARIAASQGFATLGFADHTPWPYASGYVSGMRMGLQQFEDYRRSVEDLRERYAGRMEILLGLECEAFPAYTEWLRDLKAECLDFVLLGNHYDYSDEGDARCLYPRGGLYFGFCTRPEHVRRYCDRLLAGMATGLYDCVAHPDLFMNAYPAFDAECRAVSREICQAANAFNLPLEYNLLGLARRRHGTHTGQGYPHPDFWQIAAENGCRAIIGFDAHTPESLERRDLYDDAVRALNDLGLTRLDALST